MMPTSHLQDVELIRFRDGNFADFVIREHIAHCGLCRGKLVDTVVFAGLMRGVLVDVDQQPAFLHKSPWETPVSGGLRNKLNTLLDEAVAREKREHLHRIAELKQLLDRWDRGLLDFRREWQQLLKVRRDREDKDEDILFREIEKLLGPEGQETEPAGYMEKAVPSQEFEALVSADFAMEALIGEPGSASKEPVRDHVDARALDIFHRQAYEFDNLEGTERFFNTARHIMNCDPCLAAFIVTKRQYSPSLDDAEKAIRLLQRGADSSSDSDN